MVLEYEYRVVFQPVTPYGEPAGFTFYHEVGPCSIRTAWATRDDHYDLIGDDRMEITLERSPIGGNTWLSVDR